MSMRVVFVLLIIAALLSSCANSADDDLSSVQTDESSSQCADEKSNSGISETAENQTFTAQRTDYSDGVVTYMTDSQHQVEIDPRCFENETYIQGEKLLSESIISKCKTEKICADIRLNQNGDKIISCDVISCNGEYFDNLMLNKGKSNGTIEDDEASMRRISGSKFEIYKGNEKLTADINDMDNIYKADFPDQLDRIVFDGYRLNSGSFILLSISVYSGIDEMGSYIYDPLTNEDKYSFFGTISELSEEYAALLLNDSKTTCKVPYYYKDGELETGMQVMVTLNAPPELYNSGESFTDDFAVFHTDPNEYDPYDRDINDLAFAQYSKSNINEYVYTNKNDI